MKIAFLGDSSLTHVIRWSRFFAEKGHDVLLISFEKPLASDIGIVELKPYLPTKLGGYLSRFLKVKSILRAFEPDLINSLYISGYGLIGALTKFHPYVASCLGSDILVDYPSSLIHKMQITYALKKADLVTVDAENLASSVQKLGVPKRKILKVYFGIEDDTFHPPEKEKAPSERKKAPVIISTRKLYPIYNVGNLVEAAPKVLEKLPGASFVICGDGPERSRLETRAKELGIWESISFMGNIDPLELADKLRESDIYVSTSISDSTSVSLLEAMACGAVPVVSDIEANREWLINGENGVLFDLNDATSLASAIVSMIKDDEAFARARKKNLAIIRERALWQDNMEKVEKEFEKLTAERRQIF